MPTDPGAAEVAPTRAEGVALALIIGCAIVLRATFLAQPVRYDEAVTIMAYAREPLVTAASLYDAPNNHVFNSVLAHLASRVAGDTLWAYRLPVFVAGILTVPATWLAGRRLFGPEAGLLGAALAASNFALVLFSTNSRGYAIQTLLFVLLVAASLTLFETRRWRPWLAFGVVGALGFYTIPTMLMGWGGLMLWFLLESAVTRRGWPERALVVRLAITNGVLTVLTLALYAPVFIVSGWRALTQNPWVTPITAGAVVRGAPRMVAETLGSWTTDLPRTAVGLLAIGLVCSLVWPRDTGRPRIAPGWALVAFIVPLLLVQRVLPPARVWLFLLPLVLLASAAGLAMAWRRWGPRRHAQLAWSALAVLACTGLTVRALRSHAVYFAVETGGMPDAEPATRLLGPRLQPGDRLISANLSKPQLTYYFDRAGLGAPPFYRYPGDVRRAWIVTNKVRREDPAVLAKRFNAAGPEWSSLTLVQDFPTVSVHLAERRR